jgi:hypothetical protein
MNGLSHFILDSIYTELRDAPTDARNAYFKIKVGGHNFQTIRFKRHGIYNEWFYMKLV